MDDWLPIYQTRAARQGWQLVSTEYYGNLEVQIHCVGYDQSLIYNDRENDLVNTDEKAVYAMKQAYLRREDHAVLAFHILKNQSLMEFTHWAMDSWKLDTQAINAE